MIFDHRTYTVKPGTLPKQLELYEKHGKTPQERHLGKPLLYGVTETGASNTNVDGWVNAHAGDPQTRRAARQPDCAHPGRAHSRGHRHGVGRNRRGRR